MPLEVDIETTPIYFACEILELNPYRWQEIALSWFESAAGHRVKGSICTPNGAGKDSVVIAALALWWISIHRRGRVVITSKDARQIDEQTMPALIRHRHKFGDWKWIEREIETPTGGKIIAFTTDDEKRCEGFHRETRDDGKPSNEGPLLLIANEAKGIDEGIFTAFDRCTYDGLLYASSPGMMRGRFYESQMKADLGFKKMRIGLDQCPHIPQERIDDIIKTYGANSPFTRSTLHGEFLEAFDGKPVYYAYNQDIHEGENLPWIKGAYLVRGWDFGTCNAVTWSMYWQHAGCEYLHVLWEQYLEGSDTDRQAEAALRLTQEEFAFWNDRTLCAGLLDFCDPSGVNANFGATYRSNSEGKAERIGSCVQILHTHGIRPGTILWQRGIALGVALINRFLGKRDHLGRPCFKLDRKSCPILARAFRGGYAYGEPGESGYDPNKPEPRKGLAHQDFDFSHQQDSFRYSAINTLRLLKHEYQQTKEPLFRARETVNLNPERAI